MKLIGRIPESEVYLVAEDEFPTGEPPPADAQAQVLRVTGDQATLYPPREFHSITAHMPRMEEYTGSEGELDELLAQVDTPASAE
jgi:hypothetical protein